MSYNISVEQKMIIKAAKEIAKKYGPEYWLEKEEHHEFPNEYYEELGKLGFLGLGIPEEYGGTGTSITEEVLAVEALCSGGGAVSALMGYFSSALGSRQILANGNDAQKEKYLPRIASGKVKTALGLTEADAGTNSLNIQTFAKQDGDHFIINGNKVFISKFEDSQAIILVTRTTEKEQAPKKSLGISLFIVDLPNDAIRFRKIPKHGMHCYPAYELWIDDLRIPRACLLGEEDKGWFHLLDSLNPERILGAAGAVGTGRLAIKKAVEYANERIVFDCPIAAYQGIQFPLASAYAKLECAWFATLEAATLYDQNEPQKVVGDISNMAKYVSVEASIEAVYHAMQTLGGYGYAKEFHIERWWKEIQLLRLAPITQQMTLNYIGENVLGMTRSY